MSYFLCLFFTYYLCEKYYKQYSSIWGILDGSDGKESACNERDPGSIPGSGSSPGEGFGNQLQYFCLENSTDRGAWRATVDGVAKSQARLSD